jgi:hypothetical protein
MLSLPQPDKDKIKSEILKKINSSLETDNEKLTKLNHEDRHAFIEFKKKQIKNEVDSYIAIYYKMQEKKVVETLNNKEKSIISDLERKSKDAINKYKLSSFKNEIILSIWKKSWSDRIHKDVEKINTMTLESRDKYISTEWYNTQKYLDTLYAIASKNTIK